MYSGVSQLSFALPPLREPHRVISPSECHPFFQGKIAEKKASVCATSVFYGLAASIFTGHPLPFFMGVGGCLPRTSAQQKIGNEFQVNTYTNNSQYSSSVASFSNGNFVVTWISNGQDGSEYGIFGQLFDENGMKIGNEFQVNTYTDNSQWGPSVTSLGTGNFVVTWESYGQDKVNTHGIFGQLFDGNATKLGNEFRVNTYVNNAQRLPSVTSFSNGNFVVTWHSLGQDQATSFGVFCQIFSGNRSQIGNEFQVNTYFRDNQQYQSVASFSNGNFVVTWESEGQDGSGSYYGVYGQLLDGNGTKIGSEFRANSYTNLNQGSPSVASFPNGNFVVTWDSDGQDGSTNGVYGGV